MACLAHDCTNPACDWYDYSNREKDHCPECGAAVTNEFDEPLGFDGWEDDWEEEEEEEEFW
jgi:hypothetical protein